MSTIAATELVDTAGGRRFRLIRKLGAGGFAEVWLARCISPSGIERLCALKLLHRASDVAVQAVERLRDEAAVLAGLHHPVILDAHDLVQLGEDIALVTEYVDGQDLRALIHHPTDPLPLGPLLEVVSQVASALDAAFRQLGIVHRDVKPPNIRIGRYGDVKLLDFGIARSELLARVAQTSLGIIGSPGYLAPERFTHDRGVHPGSDVFSLGCVLYEGVAREGLYRGMDMAMIFGLSASREKFEPFIAQRLGVAMPDGVREMLVQMLTYDPDLRIDAASVAQRCDAALATLGDPAALRHWCRQHPWPQSGDVRQLNATSRPGTERNSAAPESIPAVPTINSTHPESSGTLVASVPNQVPARPRVFRPLLLLLGGVMPVLVSLALVALFAFLLALFVLLPEKPPASTLKPIDPANAVPLRSQPRGDPAPQPLAEPASGPPPEPAPPAAAPSIAPVDPPAPDAESSQPPAPDAELLEPPTPDTELPEAPPERLVSVIGPPGDLFIDGKRLGPTNVSYSLPVGPHTCSIRLGDAEPSVFACPIRADSRTILVPVATVTVAIDGAVPAQLRDERGATRDPSQVPLGESYDIFADFGSGWQKAGQITISEKRNHTVRCNKIRAICTSL